MRFVDAPGGAVNGEAYPGELRIRGNGGAGVAIVGTSDNVQLAGAEIADNAGLGIDLGDDGVTANDPLDDDAGPNGLQNRPVLRRIDRDAGVATVSVRMVGAPDQGATVHVYSSPACDASGSGEGATFVGSGSVQTDGTGTGIGNVQLSQDIPDGVLTATATFGGTSEFSACFPADGSANEENPWQPPAEPIVWDGFGQQDLWVGAVSAAPHRILEGSAAAPGFNPGRTRIVFASDRGGQWDLWTVAIDGSDLQQLTDDAAIDQTPSWSPDGSRIAFSADDGTDYEIFTIAADGTDRHAVTDNASYDAHPSWSPDGRRLVFDSGKDIWVSALDGSGARIVTGGPSTQESPVWSPDGRRVAYHSTESGAAEIALIDVDVVGAESTRHYRRPRGGDRAVVLARRRPHRVRVDPIGLAPDLGDERRRFRRGRGVGGHERNATRLGPAAAGNAGGSASRRDRRARPGARRCGLDRRGGPPREPRARHVDRWHATDAAQRQH